MNRRVNMRVRIRARAGEKSGTQLHAIRNLMLSAARCGAWMTLGEIAGLTEIGEASISAQLRHLRKSRHGRHRVEKRRRTFFVSGLQVQPAPVAAGERHSAYRLRIAAIDRLGKAFRRSRLVADGYYGRRRRFRQTARVRRRPEGWARLVERRSRGAGVIWEYRVLPPAR